MCFRHIVAPSGTGSACGEEERCIQSFGRETLENIGVDGRKILKWMMEVG